MRRYIHNDDKHLVERFMKKYLSVFHNPLQNTRPENYSSFWTGQEDHFLEGIVEGLVLSHAANKAMGDLVMPISFGLVESEDEISAKLTDYYNTHPEDRLYNKMLEFFTTQYLEKVYNGRGRNVLELIKSPKKSRQNHLSLVPAVRLNADIDEDLEISRVVNRLLTFWEGQTAGKIQNVAFYFVSGEGEYGNHEPEGNGKFIPREDWYRPRDYFLIKSGLVTNPTVYGNEVDEALEIAFERFRGRFTSLDVVYGSRDLGLRKTTFAINDNGVVVSGVFDFEDLTQLVRCRIQDYIVD